MNSCGNRGPPGGGSPDAVAKHHRFRPFLSSPPGEFCPALVVAIDIKPESCPNPFRANSHGWIPVAILGSDQFDVTEVDLASVRLEDVAPRQSDFEDVATPFGSTVKSCKDCTVKGPDGFLDLTLKFKAADLSKALGSSKNGSCHVLTLSGVLLDGTSFTGQDVIRFQSHP